MDTRSTENRPRGPWRHHARRVTLPRRHAAVACSPPRQVGPVAPAAWRQQRGIPYAALHRAPKKMIAAPIRQTALPIRSVARGIVRSTMASQASELTM